jgi:predicted Zn-dependent protease
MKATGKKKAGKKGSTARVEAVAHTPEALIEQGNVALAGMKIELAAQFFKRALELSPSDTNIMDALADVLLQMGDQHTAFLLLQHSTSTTPSENPFKWCYFAQLQAGEEAVASYRTGIRLMADALNSAKEVCVYSCGAAFRRLICDTVLRKAVSISTSR